MAKVSAPIEVRTVNPLEDATWDEQVLAFPAATSFHSAAWAEVLHQTYGYTPLYLTAWRDRRLVGILPLMEVRSRLTGTRGVSLPFTDFCPPLVRDADAAAALLAEAQYLCRSRKWKYLDLKDFCGGEPKAPCLSFVEHTLALSPNIDALSAGCRPAVRRAIRKAEKEGLSCTCTTDIQSVRDFYRLHCLTRRRHGLPVQPFRFFKNLHDHVLTKGHGFVILARLGGRAVAGSVFLRFGGHAMYKFGASDPAHLSLRGNNLAMWHGIRVCAEQGCSRLSMGKTSLSQESLSRFKAGYGTTEHRRQYIRWDDTTATWTAPDDNLNDWSNQFCQLAPIPILRIAGKLLYRHVG